MGVAMSYPADMSLFLIYSLARRFFLPRSSLMALPWTLPEGKCVDKESPFSAISQYFRGSLSPHFQWQLLLSQPQGAPLAAGSSPCPVLLFFPLPCALAPSGQILIFSAGCQSNSCLFGTEQLSQWLNFIYGKSLVQIHKATLFRVSFFQTLCQYQLQHTVFQKFRNLSTHITNQRISLLSHSLEHSMVKVLLLLTGSTI